MHTPLTDIFCPLEENNDENIEEEVEEEKPEKEEENEQDTGSSKKEGEEDDDDEPNLWISQRNLPERSPTVPVKGKILTLCRKCSFQCPITCKYQKATKDLFRGSKMASPYQIRRSTP